MSLPVRPFPLAGLLSRCPDVGRQQQRWSFLGLVTAAEGEREGGEVGGGGERPLCVCGIELSASDKLIQLN